MFTNVQQCDDFKKRFEWQFPALSIFLLSKMFVKTMEPKITNCKDETIDYSKFH